MGKDVLKSHNIDLNKTIVARSIAYIGYIFTKRESLVQSGEQTFELSKNPEFKLYLLNPPESAFG
jgi:hypothetical protein